MFDINAPSKPVPMVNAEDLELKIKNLYSRVADHPEVEYHFEMGRKLAERLGYPKSALDQIPQEAIETFAGVGYVLELADLREGDMVVDLGSGSGMDTFLIANQIGKSGEVFGVEMTDAQLRKAQRIKNAAAIDNAYFIQGHIEQLPIISSTIDVVISNGVINLSCRKKNVFKEAARVLKPGGKLVIADIISSQPLPESISSDANLWAACVGGAAEKNQYLEYIRFAGFEIQTIQQNPYEFYSNEIKGTTAKYGIHSSSILAIKQ